MSRAERQQEACIRLKAILPVLDVEYPDWRGIEFMSRLDDYAAQNPLKRLGIGTLGELADGLLAGHGFVAVSMFGAVERLFGSDPRLCSLVLSLFGQRPVYGGRVLLADVKWTLRTVHLPLVCPRCGADTADATMRCYDTTWRDIEIADQTVVVGEVLADYVVDPIPTALICGRCAEPIVGGHEAGRPSDDVLEES